MELRTIARIQTDFKEKFGIPRQSGLVPELTGKIVFEPSFRKKEAFRGLEGYSHLWLIWGFSQVMEEKGEEWSPLVRPPRLGGNTRVGVFSSRSPFRPNPLGLSCVKLEEIIMDAEEGPILIVSGVDLLDGTPIYDIKPYLPQVDAHEEATAGFSQTYRDYGLQVEIDEVLLNKVPIEKRKALMGVLAHDPRPGYQHDNDRIYGICFAKYNVRFTVNDSDGILKVMDIEKC